MPLPPPLRKRRAPAVLVFLALCLACLGASAAGFASLAPAWWRRGRAKRPGSVAEAELLAQLAARLQPKAELKELFRRFPSPENWGGNYLEPDLAMYGVLKDPEAALFVEYDGYWRHAEEEGVALDTAKNAALLAYAPEGSYVVRINHAALEDVQPQERVLWLTVGTWRSGDQASLLATLEELMRQIYVGMRGVLRGSVWRRQAAERGAELSVSARDFASSGVTQGNTTEEIECFLAVRGFGIGEDCWSKVVLAGLSIEEQLDPMLLWLEERGMSKVQIKKVLAGQPRIFRLTPGDRLTHNADWLLGSGRVCFPFHFGLQH
ncbi:unnamed protein product [Effrenium voratum]|nr:unnamed protein product [Effrenium voratum]